MSVNVGLDGRGRYHKRWTAFGLGCGAFKLPWEPFFDAHIMPRKLREWPAYKTLNKTIQDFKTVLPLLVSLSQPSVEARHWAAVMKVTGTKFDVTGSEFTLQTLLEAGIAQCAEDIEEICESAQKQLGIKNKMNDIKNRWSIENFEFGNWKTKYYEWSSSGINNNWFKVFY